MSDNIKEKEVYIREFPIHESRPSAFWIVVGSPSKGKSTFIEHLIYVNKHKYPVIKIWSGTEDTQGSYGKFAKKLFITNDYKMEEHEKAILRQKTCIVEKCENPYAVYVMDDCNTDRKLFNTPVMRSSAKNGVQWHKCLFILGQHFSLELSPDVRKCISYVALFQESSMTERKKLFDNFAIGCNFHEFCDLMDQLTGDYTCLIIDKRSESNKLEDCIFYCKADLHNKQQWEAGSKEYKQWHKDRYNPNYVETFV